MFGELPGFPQGMSFADRKELAAPGVHPPIRAGISGTASDGGMDLIGLSGGYEDDEDHGDAVVYTGQRGRNQAIGKQLADLERHEAILSLRRPTQRLLLTNANRNALPNPISRQVTGHPCRRQPTAQTTRQRSSICDSSRNQTLPAVRVLRPQTARCRCLPNDRGHETTRQLL